MTNMTRLSVVATLAAVSLSLSAPVCAQAPAAPPAPPPPAAPVAGAPPHQGSAIWDHQKELGLTDAQVAKMKSLVKGYEDQLGAARVKDQAIKQELSVLFKAEATTSKIRAKLMEDATLSIDLEVAQIEMKRNLKKVLTPDQVAKWTAFVQKSQPQPRK